MKINKFLIAGAAVAALSLSAHAQEAPTNNQQEMNPTVSKTLHTVGGFFGSLVQGAKTVGNTAVDGVKTIANSDGAQNIKNGVMKVANSEVGQTVKEGAVKSAKFIANTASDGAKAVSNGYKEVTAQNQNTNTEPTVEAASVTPVNQAASTPSLSEGVTSAKNKIDSMISFLRDKATSKETTNDNDGTKIKP